MSVRITLANEGFGQNSPESYDTTDFANPAAAISAISGGFLTFDVESPIPAGNPTGNPLSVDETMAVQSTYIKSIVQL